MTTAKLLLLLVSTLPAAPAEPRGTIGGVVANASRGDAPAAQVQVVLRLRAGDPWATVAETSTDSRGRFLFANLPVGEQYEYLPGANRDDIHYPGPHVRLTSQRTHAAVELSVYDAVGDPSPLVIRRQEILLRPEAGALRVTESITIDNPSTASYIGSAAREGEEPITLRLAVPSNFVRTTFDKEFFGRRFSLAGGKLVTGIPWPPGKREVKFTYILPWQESRGCWERPLDLPCDRVCVRVQTADADGVSCNLDRRADGEPGELVFESAEGTLPEGGLIRVELGRVPMSWTASARWLALAVLAALICGTSLVIVRHRARSGNPGNGLPEEVARPAAAPSKTLPTAPRRKRRRAA